MLPHTDQIYLTTVHLRVVTGACTPIVARTIVGRTFSPIRTCTISDRTQKDSPARKWRSVLCRVSSQMRHLSGTLVTDALLLSNHADPAKARRHRKAQCLGRDPTGCASHTRVCRHPANPRPRCGPTRHNGTAGSGAGASQRTTRSGTPRGRRARTAPSHRPCRSAPSRRGRRGRSSPSRRTAPATQRGCSRR